MAHKHLHELLQEDQEPFLLKNFIADRSCQLKRPLPKTHIQLKKRKPISETSSFSGNFCKNACLFSFHDSPDVKKSPLWSPAKSPRKNPNAIFLHIPARTAAMLLEAALRIQKQSSPKPKAQNKNVGFGIFGSILKRLTQRNRNRKREIEGDGLRVSVKDILRWDSSVGRKKFTEEFKNVSEEMVGVEEKSASEMGFSCSCNGRLSSVWSESNEEKSLDMETSSSSQSEVSAEIDFVSKERQNDDFASCDKDFCTSPFRFVLQRSPSSESRTPNFSSPATSPSRHRSQDKENNYEGESLIEEEEEEKEQFSPVSILDPPFEDDDDGHEGDDDDGDDEGSFDLECSYAIVQSTYHYFCGIFSFYRPFQVMLLPFICAFELRCWLKWILNNEIESYVRWHSSTVGEWDLYHGFRLHIHLSSVTSYCP
ncbi:hypothetical protein PVL29_010593 [Vitis rotundifolia]|uniref:Uncharacterized protein n=1 Tax=Vitis rotundifolia TaxID=103349 RepID=A0AA38ZUJ3_VITRO|nr:hypothetical protein PVL29_010593 [Vitis rotundifolia]